MGRLESLRPPVYATARIIPRINSRGILAEQRNSRDVLFIVDVQFQLLTAPNNIPFAWKHWVLTGVCWHCIDSVFVDLKSQRHIILLVFQLYWAADIWTSYSTAMHILSFAILRLISLRWPHKMNSIKSGYPVGLVSIYTILCPILRHRLCNWLKKNFWCNDYWSIGRSVANSSPPLRHLFVKICVLLFFKWSNFIFIISSLLFSVKIESGFIEVFQAGSSFWGHAYSILDSRGRYGL